MGKTAGASRCNNKKVAHYKKKIFNSNYNISRQQKIETNFHINIEEEKNVGVQLAECLVVLLVCIKFFFY